MRKGREATTQRLVLLVIFGIVAFTAVMPASAADPPGFRVRYRSADTVYLEAGRQAGLAVGDRLEVVRDGETVAVIEIIFVADHSSSAKLVEERGAIAAGDLARPLGELRPPPAREPQTPRTTGRRPPARAGERPAERRRSTRISGVATLDWESFGDDENDRDADLTTARLSLRGRDLGGLPLDLRVRLRSRRVARARPLATGAAESEDRDRLYELSLRWAGSERWSLELGRLGSGLYAGVGYLDGVSGEIRLFPGWQLGAFAGQRPELAELGFDSAGSKYGVFSRFTPADGGPWEVYLAGVHEEDDAGRSRELAVVETRLGRAGGRWSLFQRAEIDVGSDGAAGDEAGGQLTQVALALTGRLSDRSRVVLSYDRYDPLLLFEDDDEDGPAERFQDLLRQGLRASLHFGRAGALGVAFSAGVREGAGEDDTTYSLGLGLHPSRVVGFSLGGDVLAFSNPLTEGALVTLRAGHRFAGGHSLDLTLGSTLYSEELTGEERTTSWARLSTWVELPASLFARGDFEIDAGDDVEGQRLGFGLGYRF